MARRERAAGRRRTARDRRRRPRARRRPRRARSGRPAPTTPEPHPSATGWPRCPHDVVRRRPLLATCVGWSRLSEGDVDGVEAWLDAAEAGLDTTPPSTIPAAGSLAEAAMGPGGRGPLPPGHDRGLPRLGRPGPGRRRRYGLARPPGTRAGRAAGPLRAQCRRRLRRPGGLGRRRPRHRGGHVHRGGRQPARGRHGRRRAGRHRRAGEHVAGTRTSGRGAPTLRTRAGRGREPPRPGALHHRRPARRPRGRPARAGRPRRGRGAPRGRPRARRPGVAAGEPAPLVHRDGRPAAGERRPRRRDRDARPGRAALPARLLPGRAADRRDQGPGADRPGPPRRRAGVGARARGRADGSADLPGRVRPAHPRPAARRRG